MNIIHTCSFPTIVGELIIGVYNEKLCLCDFTHRTMRHMIDSRIQRELNAVYQDDTQNSNALLQEVKLQLNAYFFDNLQQFNLPLLLIGSPFQKSVWQLLINISYGKTKTYTQLAETLGNKNSVRAVAGANGANAISIIIPCHRVIASNGALTGYAGGLRAKKILLQLERKREQSVLF